MVPGMFCIRCGCYSWRAGLGGDEISCSEETVILKGYYASNRHNINKNKATIITKENQNTKQKGMRVRQIKFNLLIHVHVYDIKIPEDGTGRILLCQLC